MHTIPVNVLDDGSPCIKEMEGKRLFNSNDAPGIELLTLSGLERTGKLKDFIHNGQGKSAIYLLDDGCRAS